MVNRLSQNKWDAIVYNKHEARIDKDFSPGSLALWFDSRTFLCSFFCGGVTGTKRWALKNI